MLLSGTDELLTKLADPVLPSLTLHLLLHPPPLRSRGHHQLRGIPSRPRWRRPPKLFSPDAVKKLFHASHGQPRSINQLALQALIQAAVQGHDTIDGGFMHHLVSTHPLYQSQGAAP